MGAREDRQNATMPPPSVAGWTASGDAGLARFRAAETGLFLHFSPASVLADGNQGWQSVDATYRRIHRRFHAFDDSAYAYWLDTLFTDVAADDVVTAVWDRFHADRFDADAIAELAVAAGMRYINFTTRHVLGRMFLFKTATSPCNSVALRPRRDFVGELAAACGRRDLGLFLYVMPPFDDAHGRVAAMLTELLTQYGPIAGIWFDGVSRYYSRPDRFADLSRLYRLVRSLQPECLISFKTGASGEEDFIAPEWHWGQCTVNENGEREIGGQLLKKMSEHPPREVLRYADGKGYYHRVERMTDVWRGELRHKPIELCRTMQAESEWFDCARVDHVDLAAVLDMCSHARGLGGNLLLNTGVCGDGSIHPRDRETLLRLGEARRDELSEVGEAT
jgi:alpha-L-fucosidase